jgi:transcriptional regulator with XRE-family HTH domain
MTSLRRLIVRALQTASPSVEEIAARLGLSTSALRYYRLGKREPSADTVRDLAAVLRRQAAKLEVMAEQLEKTIHRGGEIAKEEA